MSDIVTSQSPERAHCSPNEPFVVFLENSFLLKSISPVKVKFDICNLKDLYAQTSTLHAN